MSDSAHVALFVPTLSGGGAERVMVVLANQFVARGIRVDLVVGEASGAHFASVAEGVNVVSLGSPRVSRSIIPLASYLREERPTAVISAMIHANISAVCAHVIARSQSRLIVSEHSALPSRADSSRARVARMLMSRMYRRANTIVAVSQGVANEIRGLSAELAQRVTTISNPVVDDRMLELSQLPLVTGMPNGREIVLGAGRLVVEKDFATLIRAFARCETHSDAELVILGEGPLLPELRRIAAEEGVGARVRFPGFVENPYAWMANCDVFVLSSVKEGLGNALIEAMACGAKVVSTDCKSGPAEILQGGRFGELVPVGDPEALAEAIQRAFDAPPRPEVMMRAKDFGVVAAVDAYLGVLGV